MSTPHLDCHVCRTPLPPEDLSLSHGMAFCRRCQTLIRLDRYRPPRYPVAAGGLRPQVELPAGWSIQWTAQELRIFYRWFSAYLLIVAIFAVFCLLWLGSLAVWYVAPILEIPVSVDDAHADYVREDDVYKDYYCKKVGYEEDDDYENNRFGKLLYIGGGLFLIYITLAGFLNTTVITVRQGYLTVVHVPLPWFQPPPLHTADIAQFFVRRQVVYAKGSMREIHSFYDVWAQLRQGREVQLIRYLGTPEQALFIEQELETFLGITDRPVPGEWERRS